MPAPPAAPSADGPQVLRVELAGWVEPAVAVRALGDVHPHLVWQDRSRAEAGAGRVGFVGVGTSSPADVVVRSGASELDEVLAALRDRLPAGRVPSARLGWWGWLGYELGAAALGLDAPVDAAEPPTAAFLFAAVGAEFDHDRRTVTAVGLPGRDAEVAGLAGLLGGLIGRPEPASAPAARPAWSWRHGRDAYLRLVERCRAAIAAGDAYQLCLTNRITVRLPDPADPLDVFLRLRGGAPVRTGALLRIGDWALVSASPETFLSVDPAGRAVSRPIKGTRPRDPDAVRDRALADELRTSEKERAENLMIVDLVRNDLARVSDVGSVEVAGLFDVETYPAVHQLVSTVVSRVAGDPLDAVRSLFPAGSMTGAPKHAAMRLLAQLEAGPRGVYAGAFGRVSVDGAVDLGVVIRSVVLHGAHASIGTGGGITILSEPRAEWAEIELKAAPMLRALGATGP